MLYSLSLMFMILSCAREKVVEHPYAGLSSEYFESFSDRTMKANQQEIRDNIMNIVEADHESLKADRYTRVHYKFFSTSPSAYLWINRQGISPQADTLLACLDSCERDGFEERQFRVEYIRKDIETLKNLSFDAGGKNSVNRVLARLEYNLTKAFLRYAVGQRYEIFVVWGNDHIFAACLTVLVVFAEAFAVVHHGQVIAVEDDILQDLVPFGSAVAKVTISAVAAFHVKL